MLAFLCERLSDWRCVSLFCKIEGKIMSDRSDVDKTIGELIHDLAQPLNVISLSCINIQNRMKIRDIKGFDEYLNKKVEKIRHSIEDASKIIEQMKDRGA